MFDPVMIACLPKDMFREILNVTIDKFGEDVWQQLYKIGEYDKIYILDSVIDIYELYDPLEVESIVEIIKNIENKEFEIKAIKEIDKIKEKYNIDPSDLRELLSLIGR